MPYCFTKPKGICFCQQLPPFMASLGFFPPFFSYAMMKAKGTDTLADNASIEKVNRLLQNVVRQIPGL